MTEYQYGVRIAWGDGSTTVEWSSHARALVDLHMSAEADAMPGVGVAGRELVRRVIVPGEVEAVGCEYAELRAAAEARRSIHRIASTVPLEPMADAVVNAVYDLLVEHAGAHDGWRGDIEEERQ